jgi:hypothetical protein
MSKIIRNIIKTPDGTILESKHVHDYVSHVDANGELYINDGGKEYIRRSSNIEPYEDLSIYDTDIIEKIRENFLWGTYGKKGNEPLHYKTLNDMSNSHIENILNDNINPKGTLDILKRELVYRKENNILIED